MRINIELILEVDEEHPYIDSTRDYAAGVMQLIEDLLYDDDYILLDQIIVKDEK